MLVETEKVVEQLRAEKEDVDKYCSKTMKDLARHWNNCIEMCIGIVEGSRE